MKISEQDKEYLSALYKARMAIIGGAQSYSIGGRSLTRANLDTINSEIARLEGAIIPKFRRIVVRDI